MIDNKSFNGVDNVWPFDQDWKPNISDSVIRFVISQKPRLQLQYMFAEMCYRNVVQLLQHRYILSKILNIREFYTETYDSPGCNIMETQRLFILSKHLSFWPCKLHMSGSLHFATSTILSLIIYRYFELELFLWEFHQIGGFINPLLLLESVGNLKWGTWPHDPNIYIRGGNWGIMAFQNSFVFRRSLHL